MMIILDEIKGMYQGAVVPLPGRFLSGVHRGRPNAHDGQLYFTGCDGWQTAAVRDGCFQRMRRTETPFYLPKEFQVHENGIRVTFSQPLDPETAGNKASYGIERWNYRWTRAYGSADWSVKNPEKKGRDSMTVTRVDVSDDGRSVFLHVPELAPVMQMRLVYNMEAADGALVRGELPFTIRDVHPPNK
jgi:hypothetical protein